MGSNWGWNYWNQDFWGKKKNRRLQVWLVRTRLELGQIFANETETGIHSFEETKPRTDYLVSLMCEIKRRVNSNHSNIV